MQRRELILGLGLAGLAVQQQALANSQRNRLVIIFLRGGADGLSMAVPYTEQAYYDNRPLLSIPPPDETNGALDLDGQFGLHPSMAALMPLYTAGELAIVNAASMPHGTRSHFAAQDQMERGLTNTTASSGWLGRYLNTASDNWAPLRSVSLSPGLPLSMQGHDDAIALDKLDAHQWLHQQPAAYLELLESLQTSSDSEALRGSSSAITIAETLDSTRPWEIASNSTYGSGSANQSLAKAAQLIKADIGTEVIHINVQDWDTHNAQAARLPILLDDLATGLAAFHADLGSAMEQVTVLVMTEFGRRVAENANGGTDHGTASCMLALGGGVSGGNIYGQWPGLSQDSLVDGDLAITTDYRQLLWECLQHRLGATDLPAVFPNFQPTADSGLFAAT